MGIQFAKELRVRLTFTESLLGTSPKDSEIYTKYIGERASQVEGRSAAEALAKNVEETKAIEAGQDVTEAGALTVFPRNADGKPVFWDYQWKGFFKDAAGMLRSIVPTDAAGKKIKGATPNACSKLKAYKKAIDGCVFVYPRQIPINFDGVMGTCQRPLRAATAQGERIALACSEEIPAGATCEFTIKLLSADHEAFIRECLEYGAIRGTGQWRNSGKGRFEVEYLTD